MRFSQGFAECFLRQVLYSLWTNRVALNDGIEAMMFTNPLETSTEEYQQLIDDGGPWFEMLSLFKMTRFPQGLRVIVRADRLQAQKLSQTISDNLSRVASGCTGDGSPSSIARNMTVTSEIELNAAEPTTLGAGRESDDPDPEVPITVSKSREDPPTCSGTPGSPALPSTETAIDRSGAHEDIETPATPKRRGGNRKRSRSTAMEVDDGYHPAAGELQALGGAVPSGEPAQHGHRRLNANVKRLEHKAKELDREPARAMSDLIEALLDVPASRVLTTVAERLMDQIPVGLTGLLISHTLIICWLQRLTRKAIKLVRFASIQCQKTHRKFPRLKMTMRTRTRTRTSIRNKTTVAPQATQSIPPAITMAIHQPNTGDWL